MGNKGGGEGGLFPGVQRPWRVVKRSPLGSAAVKNEWNPTSGILYSCMVWTVNLYLLTLSVMYFFHKCACWSIKENL
jgi:hypothetical protein